MTGSIRSAEGNEKLNAKLGVATFTINQPNHGTRAEPEGGEVRELMNPEGLHRVIGMVVQGNLDLAALVTAVKTELADLSVLLGQAQASASADSLLPSNHVPHNLDSTRIFYKGNSMGGMFGLAFLGAVPELAGAYLQMPGVGFANIISHSAIWLLFGKLVPSSMTGAELAAYLSVVQQAADYGDGLNFAHYYRSGTQVLPYPVPGKVLGLQYGIGDAVVFNPSTFALMHLAQVPVADPQRNNVAEHIHSLPFPVLPVPQLFEQGYGAWPMPPPFQLPWLDPLLLSFPQLNGWTSANIAAHAARLTLSGRRHETAWTQVVLDLTKE